MRKLPAANAIFSTAPSLLTVVRSFGARFARSSG
jgi:hypothetical protein